MLKICHHGAQHFHNWKAHSRGRWQYFGSTLLTTTRQPIHISSYSLGLMANCYNTRTMYRMQKFLYYCGCPVSDEDAIGSFDENAPIPTFWWNASSNNYVPQIGTRDYSSIRGLNHPGIRFFVCVCGACGLGCFCCSFALSVCCRR